MKIPEEKQIYILRGWIFSISALLWFWVGGYIGTFISWGPPSAWPDVQFSVTYFGSLVTLIIFAIHNFAKGI